MPFIGTQPDVGGYSVLDALTASATASYTLQLNSANFVPNSANQLLVSLNGVIQKPGSSFTVSGSTLTFSSALSSSDSIDFILAMGEPLLVGTPSDGTVSTAKIATNAITDAKIASGISATKVTTGTLPVAQIPAGAVIQVKSTTYSATTAVAADTSSHSWKDTAIAVSITPISTSSKIYISVHLSYCYNIGGENVYLRLKRNSTGIATGDAAGSRTSVSVATTNPSGSRMKAVGFNHLDSPNSTSAQTYTLQVTGNNTSGYIYINQTNSDTDAFYRPRGVSTITVMEIAG